MKNRKFISALLSLSMLASAFSMTAAVHAEEARNWQTWTDDFSTDAERVTYKTGELNENWTITESGYSNNFAEISNGMLKIHGVGTSVEKVSPKSYIAQNISTENTISFDLAHYKNSDVVENWGLFGNSTVRFAESADKKSFYEIGKTGSGTAVENVAFPNAGADGVPFSVTVNGTALKYAVDVIKTNKADGTTETITPTADNCTFTNSDEATYTSSAKNYQYRAFFRKVENGTTVYFRWEDADGGLYNKTITPNDGVYTRYANTIVTNATSNPSNKMAHVSVTTTKTGAEWSYTPAGTSYAAWTGSYTDTNPLARVGAGIEFLRSGHEYGAAMDNFTITYDADEIGTEPDFEDKFNTYESDKIVTDSYNFMNGQATLAEHPSGAKWVSSNVYKIMYNAVSATGKFDTTNSGILVKGAGSNWTAGWFDMSAQDIKAVKKLQVVVSDPGNFHRLAGMTAFGSKSENNFLIFGTKIENNSFSGENPAQRGNIPFAAIQSGSASQSNLKILSQPEPTGTFVNNDTITYTIEVLDKKTIKWTAVGSSSGAVTGGIITSDETRTGDDVVYNSAISKMITGGTVYPVGAIHGGDAGLTVIKTVRVWYDGFDATGTPEYFDDFSGYTADNAATTATVIDTTAHTIAKGDGIEWKTSTLHNGLGQNIAKAYVDTEAQNLKVNGWGITWMGAVNLDLGKTESLSRMKFTTVPQGRGGGAMLFKNSSESRFLVLGQQREKYTGTIANITADELSNPIVAYANKSNKDDARSINSLTKLAIGEGWSASNTSIEWNVVINADNSLSITARGNAGGYSEFEITDDVVKQMVADYAYPLGAFGADNVGISAIDDVSVWYTPYEEPIIDFDFRTLDAAQPVAAGTITYDYGNKQLLATDAATGAKWYTSEADCGWGDTKVYSADKDGNPSLSPLNGTAKANSSGLKLLSKYQLDVAANMDYKLKDVSKITAVTGGPGNQTGVRFLVSEDEKSYYELRFGRSNDNQDTSKAGSTLTFGSPRFIKVVNGTEAASAFCDAVWGSTGSDYTWNIDFDGNKININVVSGTKSWDYTYTDTDIASMMSESKYPVSWVVKGDGESLFKDVAIWGTPVYDAVKDNGDGTATATIQDGIYDSSNITEVVAFYNAAGNMINSQILTSDGKTLVQKTFDMGTAASVKAFVFDGAPSEGKLLNAVSYTDEISEESTNPIKVACVGDSLTEGNGSSNNNKMSYPAQLQRMLGRGYLVQNFGVGSRTVCSGSLQYTQYNNYRSERLFNTTTSVKQDDGTSITYTYPAVNVYDASKDFAPDIVVIQLGTNDRATINDADKQAEFADVYGSMIDEYKALGADVYVVVPPIADGSVSSANNQNIVNYIKPILEGFVKTKGVKMVNMQYGPTTAMFKDGLHFNDTGYNVMARTIYDAIMDKIEYSYSGNTISIKPAASVYGGIAAAAYDNSGLSGLVMLDNGDKTIVQPNVATEINTADIVNGANTVKVMAWDGFDTMKPIAKIGEKTAEGYSVSGDVTTVTGKAAPNSSVVITAYDADGNLVYVNNVLSDYDSDYSFSFAGNSASVYVNGTAVSAK